MEIRKIEIINIKNNFTISQFRNFMFLNFQFSNFLISVFLSLTFLFIFLPASYAGERVPIPLEHWSYPLLEYFRTEGILHINLETKPIKREDVKLALEELKEKYVNGKLDIDPVEDELLASLYEEFFPFSKNDFRNNPKTIYENCSCLLKEESYIKTHLINKKENSENNIGINTYLWGNIGKYLSFAEEINILYKKNWEANDTLGIRKWKNLRGVTPFALFNLSFSHLEINIGRNVNWLGPGKFGTFLLSNNYPYFDGINGNIKIKKVKFSSFFIVINVDSAKYLSGHRIEISNIRGLTLGINEFVIYSGRIEPGYLSPLLILYGEQYNRGDRDNIFWGLDLSFYPMKKYRIYSEFLIDDFQYESSPPAPNKYGTILGLEITEPFHIPRFNLSMEYTIIRKWVYTHKYPENVYSNYSLCLGHPLGPDGDELNITIREILRWNVIPQLHFLYRRKGEGRLNEPWQPGIDPHPPFPSGIVKSTMLFDVSIFLKPFSSSEFTFGWKTYRNENLHNVDDWLEQDNEFFTNILLTF